MRPQRCGPPGWPRSTGAPGRHWALSSPPSRSSGWWLSAFGVWSSARPTRRCDWGCSAAWRDSPPPRWCDSRDCLARPLCARRGHMLGLGLAAGAMIFVVSHEVIPETHRNGHQTPATLGLMAGFAVMMMLDTASAEARTLQPQRAPATGESSDRKETAAIIHATSDFRFRGEQRPPEGVRSLPPRSPGRRTARRLGCRSSFRVPRA